MKRSWRSRAAAGAAGVRAVSIRSLAAGLAVMVAGLALLAVPALASTSITVSSGACSGGGTLFCFTPESASGTTGSAVTWTNQSGAAHTVTVCTSVACPGAPANTGSDSFDLSLSSGNGSSALNSFSSAGTYYYYCKIHGYTNMHGAVTVSAAATPPPATQPPSSGSSHTPAPSGGKAGATTPGTGAGLGVPMLLLPLGFVLILAGVAGRRRR
jgi:plastocyanin